MQFRPKLLPMNKKQPATKPLDKHFPLIKKIVIGIFIFLAAIIAIIALSGGDKESPESWRDGYQDLTQEAKELAGDNERHIQDAYIFDSVDGGKAIHVVTDLSHNPDYPEIAEFTKEYAPIICRTMVEQYGDNRVVIRGYEEEQVLTREPGGTCRLD